MKSTFHIPEPCHEKWSKMKSAGSGKRHCDVCRHEVHDFTRSAIADIRAKLSEKHVCGRYHERHTVSGSRFYNVLNAIENKLSRVRLKRISLLFIAVALAVSGCARRHTKGKVYHTGVKFMGPADVKRTHAEQMLQR